MGFLDAIKDKITGKDKDKYLSGFSKTNKQISQKLKIITSSGNINKDTFLEDLMVTLLEADLGYKTANRVCDEFQKEMRNYIAMSQRDVFIILRNVLKRIYGSDEKEIIYNTEGPTVILLVGVNGSGKTSTIAKLTKYFKDQGKKVALVAADTFRAGAIEQLNKWALKLEVPIVKGIENRDPSSVLVDGCRYALANDIDILLCDTAGRLQNKVNLMNELAKMKKVVAKEIKGAPHNTWLVLDSTTGQNGISQAELFNEVTDLSGIILTKMDGTSKGGIVIAIKNLINVPVFFITLGETVDDLELFDLDLYLYSIIEDLENESK